MPQNTEQIFDNPFQEAASQFKSQFMSNPTPSKKANIAPIVIGDYIENDEVWYVLENGNSILKTKYDSIWHPIKTPIFPKDYKGENNDKTKIK